MLACFCSCLEQVYLALFKEYMMKCMLNQIVTYTPKAKRDLEQVCFKTCSQSTSEVIIVMAENYVRCPRRAYRSVWRSNTCSALVTGGIRLNTVHKSISRWPLCHVTVQRRCTRNPIKPESLTAEIAFHFK